MSIPRLQMVFPPPLTRKNSLKENLSSEARLIDPNADAELLLI